MLNRLSMLHIHCLLVLTNTISQNNTISVFYNRLWLNHIKKWKITYPSITNLSNVAGLSQTGHIQVGFLSFICKYNEASKHCRCVHVQGLHGVVILIFPRGHRRDTLREVVAISLSASSLSFSLTVIKKINYTLEKLLRTI